MQPLVSLLRIRIGGTIGTTSDVYSGSWRQDEEGTEAKSEAD